ncbi:MAG: 2-isopropylmalate synthase, partial [Clostridiales bacterium]|nr:2-isopropylmalate synthase [Clostridiales bacterium]
MEKHHIDFFDTTLRDGEQTPGVSFHLSEKIKIAKALELLGVDIIEAGFAAASKGDFKAIQAISKEIENATVCSLARCVPGDIL